jgi:isopenicillin-N N-acyltransferase like protein
VTPPPTLELLRLAGSHREVGAQMGEADPERVRAAVETSFAEDLPAGRTREEQLRLAEGFRAFTAPRLPWLLERLDACAEAAGVDALAFFATTVEELWYDPRVPATQGRCSDLVAGPAATADGHLLVGHTNDLRPAAEDELVAMEIAVPGEPTVLQLGGIPWLSVGWNDAGLSLTGNELSPNDERLGISRSHQVLEMMRAPTLDAMVAEALRPDRASSYNNVLASAEGEVVNVEGSATDAELTGLDERDHLAHTNHYACERMVPFEGDAAYAVRSARRLDRARALLAAHAPGTVTAGSMRAMLSDHEGAPDAICRHPDAAHPQEKTVFWCVADLTEGRIDFGRGNPCDSVAQAYVFAAWPGR